jgi:predicted enzyme related to lactoylglutathione lyase
VDEIGVAINKAKSLGVRIVKNSVEVPGIGWFSIIADPTGAALALWQAKQQ